MKFTSNAEWPPECGVTTSSDTHDTREAAEAVCRMLEDRGFGGDGYYFPMRTWVESAGDASGGDLDSAESMWDASLPATLEDLRVMEPSFDRLMVLMLCVKNFIHQDGFYVKADPQVTLEFALREYEEARSLARNVFGAEADRKTLQECLDATRVHCHTVSQLVQAGVEFSGRLEGVEQGLAITSAKLEEILK